MKVKKILAERKRTQNLVTVPETATLKEVSEKLCEHGLGAMLVVDPESEPLQYTGIISERDILKECCTNDDFRETKVQDAMTRDLIVCKIDDDVNYVMKVMTRKHIRHIPVLDEDSKIVAILSIRNVIECLLEEQQIHIHHLSDFAGGYGNRVF